MSTTPPRRQRQRPRPGRLPAAGARRGGPPWMNVGQPAEKSMTFGPSARRLLGRLRPFRVRLLVIVALGVTSVTLSVLGPKILGRATDIIFAGLVGKQLPAGIDRASRPPIRRARRATTTSRT